MTTPAHPARILELNRHAAPNQYREGGRPIIGLVVDACHGCGHERVVREWDLRCDDCAGAA